MVRLVIFDVDNVLVRYDRPRRMAEMAERLGRTADEVTAAVFGSGAEDAADAGEIGADDYLRTIADHLGVHVPRDVWVAARAAATVAEPAMVALAADVAAHTQVALLTNNGSLLRQEFARIAPTVAALPGVQLFASGDLGLAKPDPEVYRTVVARYGLTPADALFVDDSADYVAGARRAGLRAHLFTGRDALVAVLVAEGLTPTGDRSSTT
ncbi:MAG TPA: HAD family phosphatase [Acidimicrobiales bacterium]